MIKDYISKMDPQKLISILEERGDFYKVNDAEDYKTYQYIRWGETLRITVPVTNPQLNAYHLANSVEAVYFIRNIPRDFTILRCLNEADILKCIEGIKDEAEKIKQKNDAGTIQDMDVQELLVLCEELMEIRYVSLERQLDIAAKKSLERYGFAQRIADTAIENHRR